MIRWIARLADTRGSCVFNARVPRVSREASIQKMEFTSRTPRDSFGFLDWNVYFHEECNYSHDANEMM